MKAARVHQYGPLERLQKSHAEWRALLPPKAYEVLFEKDTERPFTSPLNDEKRNGTYVCAAPIEGHMATKRDFKLIWPRTEYHCARCGGHHGHLFGDGPRPTGQRWCSNGLALRFVPEGEALPPLRS